MKQHLILLSLFIQLICLNAIAQKDTSKAYITQSNITDAFLVDHPELSSAVSVLKNYLQTRDTTFVYQPKSELSQFIHHEYFDGNDANGTEQHVLSFYKLNDSTLQAKVVNRLNPRVYEDFNQDLYTIAIFNFELILKESKWKINYRLRDENYVKTNHYFGFYLSKKNNPIQLLTLNQFQAFIASTTGDFKISIPKNKLIYIVDYYDDAYSIFGFDFHIENTGRYIRKLNYVISNDQNPLNKHEISHYLFSTYNLTKLLSEGTAVYLGGTGKFESLEQSKNWAKTRYKSINDSIKSKYISSFLNDEFNWIDEYYGTFYYSCAGMLVERIIQKIGISNFASFAEKQKELTAKQLIEHYLIERKSQSAEDFLKNLLK